MYFFSLDFITYQSPYKLPLLSITLPRLSASICKDKRTFDYVAYLLHATVLSHYIAHTVRKGKYAVYPETQNNLIEDIKISSNK